MLRFNATAVTKLDDHAYNGKVLAYEWNLETGETGEAVAIPHLADVTIQMTGTFGAAVAIHGSLDPVLATAAFAPLNDISLSAISRTTAGIATVLENVYWIRPVAGAVTAVRVLLLAHE